MKECKHCIPATGYYLGVTCSYCSQPFRSIVSKSSTIDFLRSRKSCGLTLREVEKLTGISNAYLSQLETGKIKKPSHDTVTKLTELYAEKLDTKPQEKTYSLTEIERAFCFGYLANPANNHLDNGELMRRWETFKNFYLSPVSYNTPKPSKQTP